MKRKFLPHTDLTDPEAYRRLMTPVNMHTFAPRTPAPIFTHKDLNEVLKSFGMPHTVASCKRAIKANATEAMFWAKQWAKSYKMSDRLCSIVCSTPTKVPSTRMVEKRNLWITLEQAAKDELYKLMQKP